MIQKIPDIILDKIDAMYGQPTCYYKVHHDKSLHLGFGEIKKENRHGEWEIGTYYSSWRISHKNKLICGSDTPIDSIKELQQCLETIVWGEIVSINHLSEFDLRIVLKNEIFIDFLCTINDDEAYHIFFPKNEVAVFLSNDGWKMGSSDKPWV